MKQFLLTLGAALSMMTLSAQTSPNGKIQVKYEKNELVVAYQQNDQWQRVAALPISMNKKGKEVPTKEVDYQMLMGKKSHCTNAYNQTTYKLKDGYPLQVRVYNDGVAFGTKYSGNSSKELYQNLPIDFSSAKNNWLQMYVDCYEEFFPKNREYKEGDRFGYPSLFEYENGVFALLSESNIDRDCAAGSLYATSKKGLFEARPEGNGFHPDLTLIIGTLADVVESTLITDNSRPNRLEDTSWIQPGVAAWVYWAYNHGSKEYAINKKYVDMAVSMKLPYVLIDAEWDEAPEMEYKGEKMQMVEAIVKYANEQGVKPMIWYNSSVGWVDGAPGPKYRLNKPEDREREFAWCEKIGVKGVKIDFFSGDNNMNIRYMVELLECAAKHHLLVNFHGATIPRGWQRTYPNLCSTEGVYGAEWYNNKPVLTNKAAAHNATLPFTRNVIGPMDYTPCAWTDSQHPHITSWAHELALTVLYESGIQHLADRPESFLSQMSVVQDFFAELPAAWDETKFVAGYPGEYAVVARRKGDKWYIAGINGTDEQKNISLPALAAMNLDAKETTLFVDDAVHGHASCTYPGIKMADPDYTFTCQPRGGFVMVVTLNK